MIFAWVKLKPLSLDDYVYPDWTKFVGWVGATSFIIFILVSIIKSLRRTKGPLAQVSKIQWSYFTDSCPYLVI